MTTYHEPQPQSRRAVRQSERGDASESAFADNAFAESGLSDDMWDTTSRRAAQLPPVSSLPEDARPAGSPEPLTYSTLNRAATPAPEGPTFRSRGSAAPQPVPYDPATQPPTEAIQQQPSEQAYRVRDFSPAGSAPTSAWSQPAQAAPAAPPSDLDYHTEARFRAAAAAAPLAPVSEVPATIAPINRMWAPPEPAAPEPARVIPANSDFPLEQTFTRRELRAMQQAEEAAAAASLQSQQPAAVSPTFQPSSPQTQQPAAAPFPLVEPTLQTQQPVQAQQPVVPAQPAAQAQPVVEQPQPVVQQQSAPPALPPVSPTFTPQAAAAPVAASPFESLFTPSAPAAQPEPVASIPAEIAPAPVADEASPWTPPTGHWSTQVDDDEIEITLSRRIGSGTTTTSALVLPSIPNGTDIRGPLTSTGEIMLTGSIDLPRSLGTTGQSDRYDGGGIDDLFDLQDHEVISTDSSPVRAIRAVSTHTSGHGVTHTQKPKGTRALTALLIAASSMAVVVAGLLVAAFAFNVF